MKTTNNKDNSIKFGDISLEYFHNKYAEVKLPKEYKDLFVAVSDIIVLKTNKRAKLYGGDNDSLTHVIFPLGKIKGWIWAHEYNQEVKTSVEVEFSLAELTVRTYADNKSLRSNDIFIPGYFENDIIGNRFHEFGYLSDIVSGEHKEPTIRELVKNLKVSSQLPNRLDDGYGNYFELEKNTKTIINNINKIVQALEELLDLTVDEIIDKGDFASHYFEFTKQVWVGGELKTRCLASGKLVDKLINNLIEGGWRIDAALTKILDDGVDGFVDKDYIKKKLKELGDK